MKVMACERCGGPLTYGAAFCAYCRTPLQWSRHLVIERGEPYFTSDFSRDPLPGGWKTITQRPDGTLVDIEKDNWELWGQFGSKQLKDGCVAVRGVAMDPDGSLGVYARLHQEGEAKTVYQVKVYPAFRVWRMRRESWWKTKTYVDVINDWEFHPAIRGVGQVNDVELRFADSVFQIVLNDVRVSTIVDASFGFGGIAWVAASHSARSRILLQNAGAWRAR
jgi:hypothetical protein